MEVRVAWLCQEYGSSWTGRPESVLETEEVSDGTWGAPNASDRITCKVQPPQWRCWCITSRIR
jgi:hypothetical protein